MTYTVLILRRAQRELQRLPQEDYERVREAMRGLARNPRPTGCLALTGRAGWRIRVGDYRVIYEIDDAQHTVTIAHVGHRRDVYR
jgi:mRNA interferase RelE/StbE